MRNAHSREQSSTRQLGGHCNLLNRLLSRAHRPARPGLATFAVSDALASGSTNRHGAPFPRGPHPQLHQGQGREACWDVHRPAVRGPQRVVTEVQHLQVEPLAAADVGPGAVEGARPCGARQVEVRQVEPLGAREPAAWKRCCAWEEQRGELCSHAASEPLRAPHYAVFCAAPPAALHDRAVSQWVNHPCNPL